MSIKLFTMALTGALLGEADILLAWNKDPTPALLADIVQATRAAVGRDPLVIDLHRASASEARHAFIQAVCSGSSVVATGLDTLGEPALEAALLGLASLHQWNPKSFGVGLSNAPLALGVHRFKAIHQEVHPESPRPPRF